MSAIDLHFDCVGHGAPLVILHGLFGAATNWRTIARKLSARYGMWLPDARNHGRSPWTATMDYANMTNDLFAFMDARQIANATIIGHSMGGKTAMHAALVAPQRFAKIIIVDIAPVRYEHSYEAVLNAMEALPVDDGHDGAGEHVRDVSDERRVRGASDVRAGYANGVRRASDDNDERPGTSDSDARLGRAELDARLAVKLPEADVALRGFLLQNLVRTKGGGFQWRCNLKAVRESLPALIDFPKHDVVCKVPALFIYGAQSDYVGAEQQQTARHLFPNAQLQCIADAGHWLHTQNPEAFLSAARRFLEG